MAERDFSLMNAIVADKSRTSQLLLLAKMYIKTEIMGLARSCKQCKVLMKMVVTATAIFGSQQMSCWRQ